MAKNYIFAEGAEYPYQYKYEHMAVTVDCAVFTYEDRKLKILLIKRGQEPYIDQWALPGGFLRMNETAREGALRELKEETSLSEASLGELGVFSDVDRDPRERVITIAWYALVKHSVVSGGDDAAEAGWFPIDRIPKLAFDHQKIFDAAMERLKRDIHFEPVGFNLLDDTFTIPDLQNLYETILGTNFDRRNFQRKLLASGILEAVPEEDKQEVRAEDERDQNLTVPTVNNTPSENDMASPSKKRGISDTVAGIIGIGAALVGVGAAVTGALSSKKRPGRAGTLFRLNKEKYSEMKETIGKTEF